MCCFIARPGARRLAYGAGGSACTGKTHLLRAAGFTLVELLVVIAVIGILISLLLPAVQAAREAARRIQCTSNLKQLHLAVLNYADAHRVLPEAGITDSPGQILRCRHGKMFSWIVLILPQMEQMTLHDQFDFDLTVLEQPADPQAEHISLLLCPSDQARERFLVDSDLTAGKRFAKGNYAAYVSPYHVDEPFRYPGTLGVEGWKVRDDPDGLSNTLMLTEVRTRGQVQDQRGAWALPWTGSSLLSVDMHPHASCYPDKPFRPSDASFGQTQMPNNQGPIYDMLYACVDEAGAQLERMPCATYDPSWGSDATNHFLSAAPRSLHPGGVNAVFCDGHIVFLPDEIDEVVLAYLVSPNDGQPVRFDGHTQ